jgi:hypothetical protein
MVTKGKEVKTTDNNSIKEENDKQPPRSLEVASKGIKTGKDFAKLMSALMSDLIEGRVTPNVGNATCNAGGKLLKVVEMEYKYGTKGEGKSGKTLRLAVEESEEL